MNSRSRILGFAVACAVAAALLVYGVMTYSHSSHDGGLIGTFTKASQAADRTGATRDRVRAAQINAASGLRGDSASPKASSTWANPQIADVSRLRSAREILEFTRRTSDVELREYANWGARSLCRAYKGSTQEFKQFRTFGWSDPARSTRVLQRLAEESRESASSVRDRCADFDASDPLSDQLSDEAERERLPLELASMAMGELARTGAYEGVPLQDARQRLATLLAGQQPAAMTFALFSGQMSTQRRRLAAEFPNTPLEDWLLGPSNAAYQLAACRNMTGGCGAGSLERDIVCAAYGECRATDLESSYRRLFDLYGIPFEDTDRLANKLQRAIAARDTVTLLP